MSTVQVAVIQRRRSRVVQGRRSDATVGSATGAVAASLTTGSEEDGPARAGAGPPEIDLHDVRHSYATAGRDAKIDWKALSKRIGHADVAFTMKQYVRTDLEADRQVANTLADLIIGGASATGIERRGGTGEAA
jgi:integrase